MPVLCPSGSPLIHRQGFWRQGVAINDHPQDATAGIRCCRRGASARGTDALPLPDKLTGHIDRVRYIEDAASKVSRGILAEKVAKKLAG